MDGIFQYKQAMKQQEVFKKIGGIIKELNEQYEYLKGVDGHLNELELELFVANAHFLTDHVVILSKLNSQDEPVKKAAGTMSMPDKPEAARGEKFFEPFVQNTIAAGKIKPAPTAAEDTSTDNPVPQIDLHTDAGDNFSFTRDEEPETIRHELILDEAENWEDEDEPVENIVSDNGEIVTPAAELEHKETIPTEKPGTKKIKETAKEDVITINEKISAQLAEKSGGIAEQLHTQSISDLKPAINLNDKLLYIKELFNGYSLAYSEAIEILNRFSSFNEAETFLKKNYVVKNNWDKKPETTEKFYALLKRRYA